MKFLAILLVIVGLGLIAVFLYPILKPEVASGPAPEGWSQFRGGAAVTGDAAQSSSLTPEPVRPEAASGSGEQRKGPLCDQMPEPGQARFIDLPPSSSMRKGPDPGGARAWHHVNVWASWCKPCKAEMPMIAKWASDVRRRGGAIKVTFLSVDEDERMLQRYMAGDGAAIEGWFQWVKDESALSRFYGAINVPDPPTLPVQVVLDPQGRARCVRVGSITRDELEELARRLGM